MLNTSWIKQKFTIKKRISGLRFLSILAIVLILFNLLSTKILPKEVFLVSAAEINVYELINLTNTERASRGLSNLKIDSRLVRAAEEKGKDMIEKDYWAHYGPNGETPWEFIIDSGYEYIYAGENLAKDFSSAAPIHNAWMASPTHRSNLLNPNFVDIGIATITGEFQGQETTIVVQMFGKAYSLSTADEELDNGSFEIDLPTQGNLETPNISYPIDGDILDTGAFTVRGTAPEGDEVDIYDKDLFIGKSQVEEVNFVYENEKTYDEGEHVFYAQARSQEGQTSKVSNFVSVTVDSIHPFIKRDSTHMSYITITSDSKEYFISVEVLDNPVSIIGNYRGEEIIFENVKDNIWEGKIVDSSEDLDALIIHAVDGAGNLTQETYTSSEMKVFADNIGVDFSSSELGIQKWIIENVFTRFLTRSIRGQVNFVIALIMIFLISTERILLARTGLTRISSSPLLHLPVFVVLIFVSLIGGGGEVL